MSKGSKRRPGDGYDEGFDRIFRKPVLTLDNLRAISEKLIRNSMANEKEAAEKRRLREQED